jgi:hypothetical protein
MDGRPDWDHHDLNEWLDVINWYQGQDPEIDPEDSRRAWEELKSLNLSQRSMEFARLYYWEGKPLARVAAMLLISSQAADQRHTVLKNEVRDKLERKEFWKTIKHLFPNNKCQSYAGLLICLYYKDLESIDDIAALMGQTYNHVYHIVVRAIQENLDKIAII